MTEYHWGFHPGTSTFNTTGTDYYYLVLRFPTDTQKRALGICLDLYFTQHTLPGTLEILSDKWEKSLLPEMWNQLMITIWSWSVVTLQTFSVPVVCDRLSPSRTFLAAVHYWMNKFLNSETHITPCHCHTVPFTGNGPGFALIFLNIQHFQMQLENSLKLCSNIHQSMSSDRGEVSNFWLQRELILEIFFLLLPLF